MVYSSSNGYGFVNAAAAVAAAIGQAPFPNVEDPYYPDGSVYGEDWGINMVNAPEAWLQGYTGQGVTVAVLDTGVDLNHPDLASNIWTNIDEIADNGFDDDGNGYVDDVYGWNFFYGSNNTWDANGHGTHVAGTIAAVDNEYGTTGVAPNAKIMPIQVLPDTNGEQERYSDTLTQGIYYAVNNGARVLNLSLGSRNRFSANEQAAIEYASQQGCIVVMAAGNGDEYGNPYPTPIFPAYLASNWGVAVGAVDSSYYQYYNRAGDNPLVYVTAPGVGIYSTAPDEYVFGGYQYLDGTSMATPHVAGVVALMLSANPNLTDADVRNILATTSSNSLLSSLSSLDTPIYGFENTSQSGTHVYVGSEERQSILQNCPNFDEDGFAFPVGVAPGDDLVPLYRSQNASVPQTYPYVGEAERQNILQNNPNFVEEDLAFYAYGAGSNLGAPIDRFQNPLVPGTYFYANEAERQSLLANPSHVEADLAFEVGI
ncbi:MAG: S8 family serine peptidase [Hydrococcus sp. C42_A2020_068]|nr:S8 family serine peptidase [Hydrococcus sp. C42_A2020_068]